MLIITFGYRYKREAPTGASLVMDARCLKEDPAEKESLGPLTGKDEAVVEYLNKQDDYVDFRDVALQAATAAKSYGCTKFAVACHSGRHRSVAIAEFISQHLKLPVQHLDMDRKPTEDMAPDVV